MRTLLVVVMLAGCRSQLGECGTDDVSQLPIVFERVREGGRLVPMYAGQALTLQYCTTCHSASAGPASRGLAPVGFNFDLQPLHEECGDNPREAGCLEGQARLRTADAIMYDYRQLSWNEVDQGRMPPPNNDDEDIVRFYQRIDNDGVAVDPLPSLDDPASRELLREWLACGGPVIGPVAGLDTRADGSDPGDICDVDDDFYGICAVGRPATAALEPTWNAVFDYISSSCSRARCHGGEESPTMTDIDDTFETLINGTSGAAACGEFPLVAPGSAANSLLMHKLDGEAFNGDLCAGDIMPPTGSPASQAVRDNIREWINAGAPR